MAHDRPDEPSKPLGKAEETATLQSMQEAILQLMRAINALVSMRQGASVPGIPIVEGHASTAPVITPHAPPIINQAPTTALAIITAPLTTRAAATIVPVGNGTHIIPPDRRWYLIIRGLEVGVVWGCLAMGQQLFQEAEEAGEVLVIDRDG
ncbi:hypothetical protein BS47DRAFT_1365885 [Hydnum rufescens UP504]|uniref:Uncharacterized protein n=1 Tax=Hydnum rufescens UP504 TaxID=1448309 RepID=A0A9P6AN93_9AGAM|nr:hypothetical protein BS47DRAFT_1365885 [Hydnum rufescens UP504]